MSKAKVLKGKASGKWLVQSPDDMGFLCVDTWSEAMFLARLLANPHEYLRAAQDKAWERGKQTEFLDGLCLDFSGARMGSTPNPYRHKEDQ